MPSATQKAATRKPVIHISESDYDRIADLALKMERSAPELAQQVLSEIDRARVHPDAKLPGNVVKIGSEVEFLDEGSDTRRRVRLVLPFEADIAAGRISVMTSVGAGLIGLSEGQEINWPYPDGRPRVLRILAVVQSPEQPAGV